ncbi:hypothetical protein ACWEQL_10750 [Kitasatospora sp. NPDC004240]
MNDEMVYAVLGMLIGFSIVVLVIWQVFAAQREKIRLKLANEQEYQLLAERSAAAQEAVARELAEVQGRLAAVEKLMRSID